MSSETNASPTEESMYVYDMTQRKRGKCLIINNVNFNESPTRKGADQDASDMKAVFDHLGFESQIEKDQTAKQMKTLAEKLAVDDHTDSDCVAVFIMSHGDEGGIIEGIDEPLRLDDIFTPFKYSSTLVGKPKLFFIQACRGENLDEGVMIKKDYDCIDGKISLNKVPKEVDFFYANSTPPGHSSFRRTCSQPAGSWFIQAMKKVFMEHGTTLEINNLMNRVKYEMAYAYESNFSCNNCTAAGKCEDCLEYSGKKQVAELSTTLTKDLYFKPKQ